MTEIWKNVDGFGFYEVSNLGRVRSISHVDSMGRLKTGKVLKSNPDSRGLYLLINLYQNGKSHVKLIHRLVAKAFIPNPCGYPEVNHIDEYKTNNCANNLEWCNHVYNNNYGKKLHYTRGENNPQAIITRDDAAFIREHHIPFDRECGTTALAKRFGISATHVSAIVHGRRWAWIE